MGRVCHSFYQKGPCDMRLSYAWAKLGPCLAACRAWHSNMLKQRYVLRDTLKQAVQKLRKSGDNGGLVAANIFRQLGDVQCHGDDGRQRGLRILLVLGHVVAVLLDVHPVAAQAAQQSWRMCVCPPVPSRQAKAWIRGDEH